MAQIIRLSNEFLKAMKDKAADARDTEPPEFDDDNEGIEGGPEDALRPAIVAAFKSWLACHKGAKPAKGLEWTKPASEDETAGQFALRAAEEIRKMDGADDAVDNVGDGADWEDWIASVMRYDTEDEAVKALVAAVAGAEEMVKSLGSKGPSLSADEVKAVLQIRLMNQGEDWGKCGRRKGPEGACSCRLWCPSEATTIDEFADKCADDAVSSLLWESGPVVKLMRALGGVAKYHDWTREQVLAGAEKAKEGDDAVHAAVGAESDAAAHAAAGVVIPVD